MGLKINRFEKESDDSRSPVRFTCQRIWQQRPDLKIQLVSFEFQN